jgi:hypothetical protein
VTEHKSMLLRLDPAVCDALARWASAERRSTNAQIVFLLRRALADAGWLPRQARQMRPALRSQNMEQRVLGKTGRPVSIVGLGTWQLGADWGSVSESDALAVLRAAVESGVTFFDTADVYGDGRSERVIGRFLADIYGQGVTVATKMGRRVAQVPENYTLANFRAWTDRSRVNLGVD